MPESYNEQHATTSHGSPCFSSQKKPPTFSPAVDLDLFHREKVKREAGEPILRQLANINPLLLWERVI